MASQDGEQNEPVGDSDTVFSDRLSYMGRMCVNTKSVVQGGILENETIIPKLEQLVKRQVQVKCLIFAEFTFE